MAGGRHFSNGPIPDNSPIEFGPSRASRCHHTFGSIFGAPESVYDVDISEISPVRLPVVCLALSLVLAGVSPLCAQKLGARSWEDCLKAPDRACLLEEAMDLLYLQDRTDRRQTLVAVIAQTWAQAGEIDTATQLAVQVPDRLLVRAAVLREIAAAQARASNHEKAEAVFDEALRLAYGWKDPLQRAQTLHSIAQAQAAAGMKAAADATFDQALQAATVRVVGEKGQVTLPAPEIRPAQLLQQLAMRKAEVGEIGQALRIARSIGDDPRTRARTLLALAHLQMRAGSAVGETLDEAGFMARGEVRLLCDIAKAQARAGLTSKAVASFDEALRAAQAIKVTGTAVQGESVAGALATVADAQWEAGLETPARATLDRAATAVQAATDDLTRAQALARLAEVQAKAGDAAQGLFARALSIARALPGDRQRAQALQRIATAQVDAGLRDEGSHTFAEAVGFARLGDEQLLSGNADAGNSLAVEVLVLGQLGRMPMLMLGEIADAQRRAGLIKEAAASFEEALTAILSSDQRRNASKLVSLMQKILDNDHVYGVVAASPVLRIRLVEATEIITVRLGRAEMLSAIARAMPN
jgi:tetratricopeptide (TPR) repeat protein